jgi:hypothetical protein
MESSENTPYIERILQEILSGKIVESEGITLLRLYAHDRFRTFRDDAAIHAMEGLLAAHNSNHDSYLFEELVRKAYAIADLMSAKRSEDQ